MNIIQRHADEFFKTRGYIKTSRNGKDIIDDVRSTLYDYKKTSYKIQFVERLIYLYKDSYDKHLLTCNATDKSECPSNRFHEDILFFLQEELEEFETILDNNEFSQSEKQLYDEKLEKILYEINLLKLGQEITFEDFKTEFEELKDYYFLNKKNWSEMFIGKMTQMVASGIIGETVSKEIVNFLKENYTSFLT